MASDPQAGQPTFDVFDTVLTRAVGSPEAVFLLLGRRLWLEGLVQTSPEAFARARIAAEERAHANHGVRCCIQDIYREAAPALRVEEHQLPVLIAAECEVESAVLRPVPAIARRLADARAVHGRIIFISYTYFSSAFVRDRLAQHGLWQEGDRCYASCEWAASRASGELYEVIACEERSRQDRFFHTGNDPSADDKAARAQGWGVAPFLDANLNHYERILEAASYATDGMGTALAGAARLARLSVPADSPRTAAIRDAAAGVVEPVLAGYVLWLLRRAHTLRLRRLYFLARDGQVLLQLARPLARHLGLDFELRYLYASRQAWNPAATVKATPAELAWIWDTAARELEQAGLPRAAWARQLSPFERAALGRVLRMDEVRQRVLESASEQPGLLLRYFDQEGLFDDTPYGLVDLGWYGSMQKALAAILAAAGFAAPPGFYFALHSGDIVDEAPLHREAYFFDEREHAGYVNAVPNLIALMEMLCTADHGTAIGFEEGEGGVRPVLAEKVNTPAMARGLPVLRGTVAAFADGLLLDGSYVDPFADVRAPLAALLSQFSRYPSVQEALAWGSFPWEDGLGADVVRNPFAKPYGPSDLVKAIRVGSIRPKHRAAWIEGSLALSPAPLRAALRLAGRLGRERRALRARLRQRRR